VSTGSAYGLVINATSGVSGSAYAISASNGIIIGTTISASNLYVSGNETDLGTITAGTVSGNTLTSSNDIYIGGNLRNGQGGNPSNSNFVGASAGVGATGATNSNFLGTNAGNGATNAIYSNFFGQNAGSGSTAANSSNFFGQNAGSSATNAINSNFLGTQAGQNATNADHSNFLGAGAGIGATNANASNFIGSSAGSQATYAAYSNFFGNLAGNGATSASNSNFFGQNAGYLATNAYNSAFIGQDAGNSAANANNSNFIGLNAGKNAISASNSNFIGLNAGNNATNAFRSVFIGDNTGNGSDNASGSIGLGFKALFFNTGSIGNNIGIGYNAGSATTSAAGNKPWGGYNIYLGYYAGYANRSSYYSNFIGYQAGGFSDSASYSTFIGYQAGNSSSLANNSIFIGYQSGLSSSVNNSGNKSSILIGDYTNTSYSDGIAIGKGTSNSTNNQFNIGNILYGLNIYSGSTTTSTPQTNGLVGIGTNNPTATLSVVGNISASTYTSSIINAVGFLGTASYAVTASNAITSSYSLNSVSSSYMSGSYVFATYANLTNITSSGTISASAITASTLYVVNSITAAAFTGSFSGSIGTAANAYTASYLNGYANIPVSLATGSLSAYEFNLTGSITTGSNTFGNINVRVSTGSAYGLVINATSGVSGSAYAISASNGIIIGTTISASNLYVSGNEVDLGNITAGSVNGTTSISGANISGGNFLVGGYLVNNTGFAANNANVIGTNAGSAATVTYSNIFGLNAGNGSLTTIANANIFGQEAGKTGGGGSYDLSNSNIMGYQAFQLTSAGSTGNYSNIFGYQAGYNAAGSPNYVNWFGYQAGSGTSNVANNSIFIGYQAGLNDTVTNTGGKTSILIGDYTGTNGNSDSISIGRATQNSAASQANIGNVFWINGIQSTGTSPTNTAITTAKVGIGTNTPNASLQVQGNISATTYTSSLSSGVGFFGTSSYALTASYSVAAANAFIQNGNSFGALATLGTNDAFGLVIKTNNTTRLTIDSSGNISSSGVILPSTDNQYTLGTSVSRFKDLFSVQSTIGALFESGLTTVGISSLKTGTVLTWRNSKLIPCDFAFDEMIMGVVQNGKDEPIVFGAEPVLVTGVINEGDYIVSSDKIGHGKGVPRGSMSPIDLFAKVIAQAVESGNGDSYTIKAMIRKL
jgi:hypothetical protein